MFYKLISLIFVLFFTLSTNGLVGAQGETPAPVAPEERTILVTSFEQAKQLRLSVQPGGSLTYQLTECPDPEAPCSATIYADTATALPLGDEGDAILTSTAILICRVQIYNGFGAHIATLEEQQSTTFYGVHGKSPFSWNDFPWVTNWAAFGYQWGTLVSSPYPGIGIQSGVGYSITSGSLYYLGQPTSHFVQVNFPSYGASWECLAT